MKMITQAFNKIREVDAFVNSNRIPKDKVVNIFQNNDGTYLLIYYEED